MENVRINGQYGKRNPLFMYQGTAGYSVRAGDVKISADNEHTAQVYTAEPSQSGQRRCGTL